MGREYVWEVDGNLFLREILRKKNIPTHAIIAISEGKPLNLDDKIEKGTLCLNMYNYDINVFLSHIDTHQKL